MDQLPSYFDHLVIPAFLAGVLAAGAVVAWFRSLKHRGRLCPQCASTTVSLVPGFPLRLMGKGMVARWCPGCGWKGLALRPVHERLGAGGKARLRGSFRWGSPPPPPDGFFDWSDARQPHGGDENPLPGEKLPPEGPELPVPGFAWRDKPASLREPPFVWKDDVPAPPPPIPFQFADEPSEPTEILGEKLPPPPIPFRFGDQNPSRPNALDPAPEGPKRSVPRLGFRWRG